ncbi:MAG: ATP-binding domain-containing protein [Ruminococcaceae bacterium]|nr:ATP-binding domain-containing protein [Oscillospiraceae bacterium]
MIGEVKTGIFNGEIGVIRQISPLMRAVVVEFEDDKIVEYSYEMLHELEPAFSITIHKSQGSEFPVVILALSDVAEKLRYRSLLYTAMTRAKKLFVIVGDKNIVYHMVDNNSKKLRFTGLKEFIRRG